MGEFVGEGVEVTIHFHVADEVGRLCRTGIDECTLEALFQLLLQVAAVHGVVDDSAGGIVDDVLFQLQGEARFGVDAIEVLAANVDVFAQPRQYACGNHGGSQCLDVLAAAHVLEGFADVAFVVDEADGGLGCQGGDGSLEDGGGDHIGRGGRSRCGARCRTHCARTRSGCEECDDNGNHRRRFRRQSAMRVVPVLQRCIDLLQLDAVGFVVRHFGELAYPFLAGFAGEVLDVVVEALFFVGDFGCFGLGGFVGSFGGTLGEDGVLLRFG